MRTNYLKDTIKFGFATLSTVLLLLSLSSCVIIINQPSAEEKELLSIQETVSKEMSVVAASAGSGASSQNEIDNLISNTKNTVNQAIQRISELKIPEKTRKFADDTVKYLKSASEILEKMKTIIADLEKLKQQGASLGQQANTVIQEKMKTLQDTISGYKTQIDLVTSQLNKAREQILKLYEQAK